MTYVFFFISISKYESLQRPANLTKGPPEYHWNLPGIVFWIYFIIQIFAYPMLAMLVEKYLYGTNTKGRHVKHETNMEVPVKLLGFSKTYYPNWFWRHIAPLLGLKRNNVQAVQNLSLSALKGQIMVLLGANGCGKSTTLNAIAGLSGPTSGVLELDGTGGIGICPQKNVLWDHLTVWEHARIFNILKTVNPSPKEEEKAALTAVIEKCGLTPKLKSRSETLSGGQKRKLQLIMMLTGGSRVCCVDEVSGGLDPLSRRKIWDILLAERGTRTFILTTHFLDEAEFLADHMVIMSKGSLKVEGSVSEIKNKLGEGYRIHVLHGTGYGGVPPETDSIIGNAPKEVMYDQTVYKVPSERVTGILQAFDKRGITDYQVTGPTIEEVFMRLAGDSADEGDYDAETIMAKLSHSHSRTEKGMMATTKESVDEPLMTGQRLGFVRQASILFNKRRIILRRNPLPYVAAFIIPIVAAALISLIIRNVKLSGCSLEDQVHSVDFSTLDTDLKPQLVMGPRDAIISNASLLLQILPTQNFGSVNGLSSGSLEDYVHFVDSLDEFNNYIKTNFGNVTPGGFYLGSNGAATTFAYRSDISSGLYASVFIQNLVDSLESGIPIATQFVV
jgi:ATP-binding cassette, subfamily A (ABC1), member 3